MFTQAARAARVLLPAAAAVAIAPAATSWGGSVSAAASVFELSEADSMAEDEVHYPRQKVYAFTKEFITKDFEDAAMLWRHGRSAYHAATAPGVDSSTKKALLDEALKSVKAAVQYDGNSGDARRWLGTILQEHSAFQGFSQQIADAFEVEAQWKQAVAINPDDATAHHLLGRWCFTVADMPWYNRSIASTLFAEPPSSSYEEARDYFAGAERITPDFWKMNQYMLAQAEGRLGNKTEGVRWLQRALALPVRTAEDKDCQAKALALLQQWDAVKGAEAAKAEAARQKAAALLEE